MKKRVVAALLVAALTVVSLVGCGGTEAEKQDTESTFTMGIEYMPESFIPNLDSDDQIKITRPILDCLYAETKDGMQYMLAESIEKSEDGKIYTLKLAKDAKWSDGEPVVVDDVLFALEYRKVSGMDNYSVINGKEIQFNKKDDKTLEIVLPETYNYYFMMLGRLNPLPAHVFDGDATKIDGSEYFTSDKMVTSGAYTVSEFNEDNIVLAARDDYYRGEPQVKKLIMRTVGTGSARQVAFENQEISYMRLTTPEDIEKYEGQTDKYNMYTIPEGRLNYLQLNPYGPADMSDDARKALVMALDAKEIIDVAYGSDKLAKVANSMMTPEQTLYDPECEGYSQNLEEAKKLAESSGLKGQTLVYIYNADRPNMEEIATVVQQQLGKIGVNLQIEGIDATAFFNRCFAMFYGDEENAKTWDLGTNGWDTMYGSTLCQSYEFFTDPSSACGFSENVAQLTVDTNGAPTDEKAFELAEQLQKDTLAENWIYPLTYTNYVMVSQKNVSGLDAVGMVPEFVDYLQLKVE